MPSTYVTPLIPLPFGRVTANGDAQTMWGFVLPYLFNPDKANLGAKVAFIFGALSVLCTIYVWAYQPECAGLSYEQLDELFIKRVPARHFKDHSSETIS